MVNLKKYKNKIIIGVLVVVLLVVAFWWGGNAPGLQGWDIKSKADVVAEANEKQDNIDLEKGKDLAKDDKANEQSSEDVNKGTDVPNDKSNEQDKEQEQPKDNTNEAKDNDTQKTTDSNIQIASNDNKEQKTGIETRPGGTEGNFSAQDKLDYAKQLASESSEGVEKGDADYSKKQGMDIDDKTGKDKYLTDPVPEGKPIPVEPQDVVITDKELTCTLSVRCDTILTNIDWLDPEKVELVPEDGVIFATQEVTFYEGESVFNVLLREMKKNKIHMEYENTPMYNSAYIEGINNLYEFDCGELSGWMYKVNDWFPNYGCSRYQLKDGDVIEWVYTCNLGIDVGGYSAVGGE